MQILITGVYRSGTEYITHLLNNHPQLEVHMYVVGFMRYCWNRYNPINEPYQYTKLLFDAAHRIHYRWKKKLDVFGILDRISGNEVTYARLYDEMMRDLFDRPGMKGWAEKTQLAWTKIDPFLSMFPDGKALLIIRDPRSVLLSFKHYTYAPSPAYLGAVFNCLDAMATGRQLQAAWGEDRLHIIRYEDIAQQPASTLVKAFEFLGLEANHELLASKHWVDELGNAWYANSAFSENREGRGFDVKESIHRWETELTDREIAFCNTIVGEQLAYYNYSLDANQLSHDELRAFVKGDDSLTAFLEHWIMTGKGVEAFPTDPLIHINWSKPANTPAR